MRTDRGSSLLGALAVSAIALVAALTVATAVSFHLNLVQRGENVQIASRLADSAIQQAVAELMGDPTWSHDVHLDGSEPGESADITFQRTGPAPFSTNNGTAGTPRDGWSGSRLLPGGKVPTRKVHVVAVGRCRNAIRTREVLIHIPEFPAALASSGKIRLINSVVGSLKDPKDLSQIQSDPTLIGPGDLTTNASGPDAVSLEQNSRVRGNVQSGGGITISPDSSVGGEVRPHRGNAAIPQFDLADFDPEQGGALNVQEPAVGSQPSQNLVGLVKYKGSVEIQGDMTIDNSLVFVNGSLHVKGGLRGVGAVVVCGNTTIEGGSNLQTDESVALISQGDINLLGGEGQDNYEFRGMLYTRGNFTARKFTILGSFIADGGSSGAGAVTLEDSFAYQTNDYSQVDFFYPRQFVLQAAGANFPAPFYLKTNPPDLIPYGAFPHASNVDGAPGPYASHPFITWLTPQAALQHENGVDRQPEGEADSGPWHWYDTVVVQIHKENDELVYQIFYNPHPLPGANGYPERFVDREQFLQRLNAISQMKCPDYNDRSTDAKNPDLRLPLYRNMLAVWDRRAQGTEIPENNFSADPNKFLQNQDKIRLSGSLEY